ncbi:hypothetical protein ETAC_14480 [Edwardsiella piscicida C07-087]|nr:hypothetical protein ETAC_14480 [Edwardsiella piscicida C07-087]
MMTNNLAKEAKCDDCVPFDGQQEIDGLTCSIYRAIEMFPLCFDIDVGFIHTPSTANRLFILTKDLIQKQRYADTPTVRHKVVNMNDTLRHHLFDTTQTQ